MELEALKGIFEKQNRSLVIGALKSHIGHSEGAAGILSCVKALLCVSKAAVPPNLHLIEVVKGHDWALIPSVFTPLTPERKNPHWHFQLRFWRHHLSRHHGARQARATGAESGTAARGKGKET